MIEYLQVFKVFQSLFNVPTYHLLLESGLVLWVIWLLVHKSYKLETKQLTEKEKEELIEEWTPDPLVPDTPPDHYALNVPVVDGKVGKYVILDGKRCLNLATHNYLGLVESPEVQEAAIKSLRKYGVGSCGPRAFYGTVDIHLELEKQLAEFMGVQAAVLYSYGFATISSAIPAYSKHGDIIFCDDAVSFAIQKGLVASRSKIIFFKHNNTDDLERLLEEQARLDKKNPKKAKVTRKFLVVEGLYINTGLICPLPRLIELKQKYKIRLFIEESCSFGVLGKTGRGVTEYYNMEVDEVDLIAASLENSMAAYGGFCCGSSFVIDQQRLSGLGYCFSASLPPLQAAVAIEGLEAINKNPDLVGNLQKNSRKMHQELKRLIGFKIQGEPVSPLKHLQLANQREPRELQVKKLEGIVDLAREEGIALTVARYLDKEEHALPPPSIRLVVNALLTQEEITHAVDVIMRVSQQVL